MRLIFLILLLLIAGGYHFLSDWYPDALWLHQPLMSIGWPVLVLLVSLILMLIGLRSRSRDPIQVLWGAFAFAGCLLIIPLIVAREQQANADETAAEAIREARAAIRLQQLRRQRELQEQQEDRTERAKTDRFVQYEGRVPDGMLAKLRQLDTDMLQAVTRQAEKYRVALDVNPTLGPEAWVRFRTLDQLEGELASHKALYEQARSFTAFVESFEEAYQQAIDSLDLQPPADRIAIAELERVLQEWQRTRLYEQRRLDVKLLSVALRALNILRDEWGNWRYLPRENKVEFTNKDQEADFVEAILTARAVIEEVRMIEESAGVYAPD